MAFEQVRYKIIDTNIYQRGSTYQVKLQVHGVWITEFFDNVADAEDFRALKRIAKKRYADFERVVGARAAQRAANKLTFAEALTQYDNEITEKKRKNGPERSRIRIISASALSRLPLGLVEGSDIQDFLDTMKSSDSNKLKYVAILSHLYSVARKQWNIRLANPVNDIEKPRAGPGRERRLEPAEFVSDSATNLAWLINQKSPTARDGDDADHGFATCG